MFSCDTMIVRSEASEYGANILAKNSDRPTGEPQPLCFFEGKEYPDGATLTMTHLTIPQVRKTYSVVGCRPYWIWGFEMGYNEKGLMIANEAEFSRMDADKEDGLLGMDMLRLALERADSARGAIDVITDLLRRYGQKACASMLTYRTYENTFILADGKEAWILETAGREWAAKRAEGKRGISNCYSIGREMDLRSDRLEAVAREKRWLAPDEPFDFAKAYTGRVLSQPLGLQRFRRSNKLLNARETQNFETLKAILRDHYEDELIAPRFGATTGTFLSICMHMRDWGEFETSASLLVRADEKLGVVARYAPCQPCLSVYVPVYMAGDLPTAMQTAEKKYDDNSLWWRIRKLGLLIAVDEGRFLPEIRARKASLEKEFEERAERAEAAARALVDRGELSEAKKILSAVTAECTRALYDFAVRESERLTKIINDLGGLYGRQKEAIEKYFAYAEIPAETRTFADAR